MKKFTMLLIVLFITGVLATFNAQSQFWSLDFETATGYTTSISEFSDGGADFWIRTDGTDHGSYVVYNGVLGSYYFAGMDIDGEGATLPVSINIDDIDIAGQTNLEFRIYLAEDESSDLAQDWDGSDYFHVGYDIDNSGSITPLLWVESSLGTNGFPLIDTDFDGIGDGIEITDNFVQFAVSIPGSGSFLDLELEFNLNSGDEDIAIDHLELFSLGGNSLPAITNVQQTPSVDITSSTTVSVSADVTDSDGTISLVELHWGTATTVLTNTIPMSNGGSGETYTTSTDIPGQVDGTTVYYEVYAEDDLAGGSNSIEYNYTVNDPATTTLPYNETFNADLGDCYPYSVSGPTKEWNWNSSGYAQINGFNSGDTEEDWLVLPGINFDSYSNESMTFDTWYRFGTDDENNYLKLHYSTDYPGLGDPTGYTWTELTFAHPTVDQTWTTSGLIDLSGITGTSVYIAFEYRYEPGSYRWWEVDNILIQEGAPALFVNFSASQTSVFAGHPLAFTDLTTGGVTPYSYSWDLDGDGFEDSTDPNPSFVYTTTGFYTVELTVTDDASGIVTETKTDYIEVIVNPYPNIVINEVDADQDGTDDQEFIEIYDGGIGNTDLSGLVVVLYNGSDDASYTPAVDLDGFSTNPQGYLVLGSALVPNVDIVIGTTNIIQNGADAVAIHVGDAIDFPNDTPVSNTNLIDALVYDTNDGDDSGLLDVLTPGQPQINEGGRGSSSFHSNQRSPNGSGGQRITTTYDQFAPTPGAENIEIFTEWTGAIDEDWENAGNWTNGLPTGIPNQATVIEEITKASPVIYGSVSVSQLHLLAGQLSVAPGGGLTTTGLFTNNGDFYMSNSGGASASYIDQGGLAGFGTFTFDRDLFCSGSNPNDPADPFGWHYLAAPIDGLSTDDLPDYFVNQWDETSGNWLNYAGTVPCIQYTPAETLDNMEAWSLNLDSEWGTYGCPQTPAGSLVQFNGSFTNLHTGSFSAPATITTGPYEGWNMFGNPYPSAISPSAFNWTGFDLLEGVAFYNGCTGNYMYSNSGNGYPYNIGPTQGFFVLANSAVNFALAGTERIHDNGPSIFKDAVNDLLTIEATGDETSDLAYIRFMEGAQAGMDKADFPKMFSSTKGLAQIYTTAQGKDLAVNALPATPIVPMGFTSVTSGQYTISAIETSDFANVILEDRFWGNQIDLLTDSYTFNYNVNDAADRFFIHFTPLGIGDNLESSINIWSADHTIFVETPDVVGDIVVYNMMGQEITRKSIEAGLNEVHVSDVNAFYVVKVLGSEVSKTGKVYVK